MADRAFAASLRQSLDSPSPSPSSSPRVSSPRRSREVRLPGSSSATRRRSALSNSGPFPPGSLPSNWGQTDTCDENIKVFVRLRPLNGRKEEGGTCLQAIGNTVEYSAGNQQNPSAFLFDGVLQGPQEDVFRASGLSLVEHCLAGYNACILAYGQTGSGKTHTMMGQLDSEAERGLAPRIFEMLFSRFREVKDQATIYTCRCSFLEVYNETVIDLLNPGATLLRVKEDPLDQGFYVAQLQEEEVHSVEEVMSVLRRGVENRTTAETHHNQASSRSHSIFSFTLTKSRRVNEHQVSVIRSQMKLVDLAGSERGANEVGILQKEANFINLSLSTFGRVVTEIVEAQHHGGVGHTHIPYRESVLTKLLKSSLEGNAKAQIIANVSPAASCGSETLSTLQFAQRAKGVRMKAVINQDLREEVLMRKLQVASEALIQQQAKAQEQEEQALQLQSAESAALVLREEAQQQVGQLEKEVESSRQREEKLVQRMQHFEMQMQAKDLEMERQKQAHTEEKQSMIEEQAQQVRVLQMHLEKQEKVVQQQAARLGEQQAAAEEQKKQIKLLQARQEMKARLVQQQEVQLGEQQAAAKEQKKQAKLLQARLEEQARLVQQQAALLGEQQAAAEEQEKQFKLLQTRLEKQEEVVQQQAARLGEQRAAAKAQEKQFELLQTHLEEQVLVVQQQAAQLQEQQQQLTAQQILTASAQAATAAVQEQLGCSSQRAEESAAKQADVLASLAADLSTTQAAYKQQASTMEQQINSLQNLLASKAGELQQLQLALSTTEIKHDTANTRQVTELEGELQAAKEQAVQLQQQALSLRDELHEQSTAQRQAATAAQGTQESLQRQLAAQQRLTASAQQATAAVQEQLAAAQTRAEESAARHSALVHRQAAAEAEALRAAATQQSSLEGVHAELDAVKASNLELQGRREQQGLQIAKLQAELSTAVAAHQQQAAAQKEQQAKLQAELSAAVAAHQQQAAAQKEQQAKLHAQVASKAAEVQRLQGFGSFAFNLS